MSHAQNMMTLITAGEDSELKKFDKKKNNSNKNLKINKNKRMKKNERGRNDRCSTVSWGDIMSGRATASRENKKWPSGMHDDDWLTTLGVQWLEGLMVGGKRLMVQRKENKRETQMKEHT